MKLRSESKVWSQGLTFVEGAASVVTTSVVTAGRGATSGVVAAGVAASGVATTGG